MSWLDRQSFLGAHSEATLRSATIGVAGLGGGGSHVAQQLAHVGFGDFVLSDKDIVEDTNLNRLVGGQFADISLASRKFEVAKRLILGVNPGANVRGGPDIWQAHLEAFKTCDVVIGGLDSVRAKHELEGFCRRFMIPYIDMGMDVHKMGENDFFISGQVVISMPGQPCLQCLGVIKQEALDEEAKNYGAAGGKPQVIWPNGVLASTAVGLCVQIVTPWLKVPMDSIYLEYDGNEHTVKRRAGFDRMLTRECSHYAAPDTGDPGFDIRKLLAVPALPPVPEEQPSAFEIVAKPSWWQRVIRWFS